ncbi:MAG: type II secretion system F family protein [Verrucomicrobia bacterium]|nr:type II secretion system F family protein [Verrucomicrobiota bacterium]
MALVVTPKQLSLRGELYHQLGAMLAAGLPLINTLESLHKNPPARSFRKPVAQLLARLDAGSTFTEAMLGTAGWLPSFDVALLEAGEQSGRLDACFKLLSGYYQERAQLARMAIAQLRYPLFVFHFAVLITPVPVLVRTGDLAGYLTQTIGILGPLYALAFLLVLACQGRHGETWRAFLEKVFRLVPFLGSARRHLALARLSAALEALLNAGVSIVNAWELAAVASGSPALRRAVSTWRPRIEEGGQPPSEILSESAEFPEMFANLYHTGEITGRLDDTLRRLHRYYQDEASRTLQLLAEWSPRLLYFAVVVMVAIQVVSFWTNYYEGIMNAFD